MTKQSIMELKNCVRDKQQQTMERILSKKRFNFTNQDLISLNKIKSYFVN